MAHPATGKRVAVTLVLALIVCGFLMTFGGYRLLDWKTYTVIRPVKLYVRMVEAPPKRTAKYPERYPVLAILPPGTKCRLVQQAAKDFPTWRMRCDGGLMGWINEPGYFSPMVPDDVLW